MPPFLELMSCCGILDQRLVHEKRLKIVLQRQSTDEPYGVEVTQVADGFLALNLFLIA